MQSTQITLHNMRASPALARRIREKCDRLGRFHPHILHCRVRVEKGAARGPGAFQVRVSIGVPGGEIVVDQSHHLDAHLAVRDAFAAARRRLKDAAGVTRNEVKQHSLPAMEVQDET